MVGSGVRGYGCRGDDGVHDSQEEWHIFVGQGILKPVGLELPREVLVKTSVCLRVDWFSGSGKTIQEVGC